MARVFVAVWPPPDVAAALAALPRPATDGVRWVPQEHLHVTLRFLGDVDHEQVTTRLERTSLPSAAAALGPAVTMLGRHVVMAPVAGLDALAAAVTTAIGDLGQAERRRFLGHVTLARCRRDDAGRAVSGTAVDLTFRVREVAVITSETHPDGARYTTRAVVPTT